MSANQRLRDTMKRWYDYTVDDRETRAGWPRTGSLAHSAYALLRGEREVPILIGGTSWAESMDRLAGSVLWSGSKVWIRESVDALDNGVAGLVDSHISMVRTTPRAPGDKKDVVEYYVCEPATAYAIAAALRREGRTLPLLELMADLRRNLGTTAPVKVRENALAVHLRSTLQRARLLSGSPHLRC